MNKQTMVYVGIGVAVLVVLAFAVFGITPNEVIPSE